MVVVSPFLSFLSSFLPWFGSAVATFVGLDGSGTEPRWSWFDSFFRINEYLELILLWNSNFIHVSAFSIYIYICALKERIFHNRKVK